MEQYTKKIARIFFQKTKEKWAVPHASSESHRLKTGKLLKENKQTNGSEGQGRNLDLARWNNLVSFKRK